MTQTPNRRFPPPLPQAADIPWEQARRAIFEALRWARDFSVSVPGGFQTIDPTTIAPDDAADAGDPDEGWAAASHAHAIVTAAATDLGNANAEGSGTSFARSDHVHKRTVRVALNGVDVGTRNRINFIASAGSVVDDSGNDEVDVTMASEDAEILAMYGL